MRYSLVSKQDVGQRCHFHLQDSLKKNTWQKNNLDFEFMDRQFLGMLIGGL